MELNRIPALVVDDSLDSRVTLSKLLEKKGYSPRSASDGQEALEILENSLSDIQLLITDNNMPNLSGVDLEDQPVRGALVITRFEGRCLKGDTTAFNSIVIGGRFCGRTFK